MCNNTLVRTSALFLPHAGAGVQAQTTDCRDFEQTVTIEGRYETATGTACRQQNGSWKVIS